MDALICVTYGLAGMLLISCFLQKYRNNREIAEINSILLLYLIIYQYKNEKIYLDYAKKHIIIMEQLIQTDTNYDVLKWNVVAVLVVLKLYDICPEKKYLVLAEKQ